MRALSRWCLIAAIVAVVLLVGCDSHSQYSARFVRYEHVTKGPLVAVVAPIAQIDDQQLAYTQLADLRPEEIVYVRYVGRSWETPQSSPEREIVGRAEND